MKKISAVVFTFFLIWAANSYAQVKVRIFAAEKYSSAVFSVTGGTYKLSDFKGNTSELSAGSSILIALYDNKIALKGTGQKGTVSDSVFIKGVSANNSFSLRISGRVSIRQNYTGDLLCKPDLGTLLFVNTSDIESYIEGVVRAESGPGKNIEYSKSQAVIARTYLYKYLDKHRKDGFDLCDNTHCQAFDGVTNDSVINRAVRETRGEVILDRDSVLIISAFHSNCGGETSPSEFVWLNGQSYLKKVVDPYCTSSPNARWQKAIPLSTWKESLSRNGYQGKINDPGLLIFSQPARTDNYKIGKELIPLRLIRSELNLRSTFFSVSVSGDSVILKGRGYGHGVGLCQEGALVMAARGFSYKQIIGFYYQDVIVSDIQNAVIK